MPILPICWKEGSANPNLIYPDFWPIYAKGVNIIFQIYILKYAHHVGVLIFLKIS